MSNSNSNEDVVRLTSNTESHQSSHRSPLRKTASDCVSEWRQIPLGHLRTKCAQLSMWPADLPAALATNSGWGWAQPLEAQGCSDILLAPLSSCHPHVAVSLLTLLLHNSFSARPTSCFFPLCSENTRAGDYLWRLKCIFVFLNGGNDKWRGITLHFFYWVNRRQENK